jgi:hypothetical protein
LLRRNAGELGVGASLFDQPSKEQPKETHHA